MKSSPILTKDIIRDTITTIDIHDIEILDNNIIRFYSRIKYDDTYYDIKEDWLTADEAEHIVKFLEGTHSLSLRLRPKKGLFNKFTYVDLLLRDKPFRKYLEPRRLIDIEVESLNLVQLMFGRSKLYVQREGFTVIAAPTGGGKTYSALNNLVNLSKVFDKVLYLNLEIPDRDIIRRATQYNRGKDNLSDNIYLVDEMTVEEIDEWAGEDKVCVIVDNVDNLVSAGDNAYEAQLLFVTQFDKWAKKKGNLGIFLTQFVKEGDRGSVLKKQKGDDRFEIDPNITYNQLSGVKQIATLSRTVVMTYYENGINYMKVLKKGSAKYEQELTTDDKKSLLLSMEERQKEK